MYINISSVDQLMKSTIDNRLIVNNQENKNRSVSFYVREKAATEMLNHIKHRKITSSEILETAATLMLAHLKTSKIRYSEQKINYFANYE